MDITNPKILKIKGLLFLVLGVISAGLLLWYAPYWEVLLLFSISVWAFSRFYYFAFYVLHHYADPTFRYSGFVDLARYLIGRRRR